jgi:hypothetical protein
VEGTGIFDKRSFLPGNAPVRRDRPPAAEVQGEGGSGTAFDVANVISLLVLGAVVLAAIYALLQRRSS